VEGGRGWCRQAAVPHSWPPIMTRESVPSIDDGRGPTHPDREPDDDPDSATSVRPQAEAQRGRSRGVPINIPAKRMIKSTSLLAACCGLTEKPVRTITFAISTDDELSARTMPGVGTNLPRRPKTQLAWSPTSGSRSMTFRPVLPMKKSAIDGRMTGYRTRAGMLVTNDDRIERTSSRTNQPPVPRSGGRGGSDRHRRDRHGNRACR